MAATALLPAMAFLLGGCAARLDPGRATFTTVVIDAGHGGHDSGADPRGVIAEKIWTLEIAKRLQERLKAGGFKVVMTRSTDRFIGLDERVNISNRERNAIFISIHFNYSRRRNIQGVETYYYTPQSATLARTVHATMLDIPNTVNRGVLTARFRVIRNNRNPAILVEGGYLTNRSEAQRIMSAWFLDRLARKLYDGIVRYRGRAPRGTGGGGRSTAEDQSAWH